MNLGYYTKVKGAVSASNVNLSALSNINYECNFYEEPPVEPPTLQCLTYFPDGATSFNNSDEGDSNKVKFEGNAKIINNPDSILASLKVEGAGDGSCETPADGNGTRKCTESEGVERLELPVYQYSTGGDDISITNSGVITDYTDKTELDIVTVRQNKTLTFPQVVDAEEPYRLNKLVLEKGAKVIFESGEYWFVDIEMPKEVSSAANGVAFELVPNAQIKLLTNEHVDFEKYTQINTVEQNPENFLMIAYRQLHIRENMLAYALIYADKDSYIRDGGVLYGAISAGKVDLKAGSTINYDCVAPAPQETFFRIIHEQKGVNCEAEPVRVEACLNSSCDQLDSSITGTTLLVNGQNPQAVTFVDGVAVTQFNYIEPDNAELSIAGGEFTCFYGDPNSGNMDDQSDCIVQFSDSEFRMSFEGNRFSSQSCESSTLVVEAIQTERDSNGNVLGCIGTLEGPKALKFSYNYASIPQSGIEPILNGTALGPAGGVPQNGTVVNANFESPENSGSIARINNAIYDDAGKIDLSVYFKEDRGEFADLVLQDEQVFTFYPANLSVIAKTNDNEDITTANPQKAGDKFTIAVVAQCNNGATTPSYEPTDPTNIGVKPTRTAPIHDTLGMNGVLTFNNQDFTVKATESEFSFLMTSMPFRNGMFIDNNSKYFEVGEFTLEMQDKDYYGHSILSSSVTPISRFIPHHFIQEVAEHGDLDVLCGDFAYTGELAIDGTNIGAINYAINTPVLTITPYHAEGGRVYNYIDRFNKLTFGDIQLGDIDYLPPTTDLKLGSEDLLLGVNSNVKDGVFLQSDTESGVTQYTFSLSDSYYYQRDLNSLTAPFDSEMTFVIERIVDQDTISTDYVDENGVPQNSVEDVNLRGIKVKYGRWALRDTFGPENSNLDQPMFLEYFDGTRFAVNLTDQCTFYNKNSLIEQADETDVDGPIGVQTFENGHTDKLELTAPGEPMEVDIEYMAPSWLQFYWQGMEEPIEEPKAVATFGRFNNGKRVISEQEIEKVNN